MMANIRRHTPDRAYVNSPPLSPGFAGRDSPSSSDDDEEDVVMSGFSSMDEEELNTVEVVFNKIYLDPLQEVMERIDSEAAGILRTGKLTVHGEAGDMKILQPLLFSLQANDSDLPVLHPQLLQCPFFNPKDENFTATASADGLLLNGCIRLGVKVDQVIYKLLSTHCCKGPGSRQADMLIETALKTTYTLPTALQRFEANAKNPPPLVLSGYHSASTLETIADNTFGSDEDDDELQVGPEYLDVPTTNPARFSRSSGISSSSSIKQSIAEEDVPYRPPSSQDHNRPRAESLRQFSRGRKDSSVLLPPNFGDSFAARRTSDENSEDGFSVSSLKILETNVWKSALTQSGDMIIGSYGESSYPILFWNSDLNVTFKLGTTHNMSSGTLIVDNSKELLKLKVINTTNCRVGFAIRSHRQSMLFRSHVIFPKDGLYLLDPGQDWTVEAEFIGDTEHRQDEYICIDLLVCQLNCNPSWNVIRRYAVLKQNHDQHKLIKKLSRNEQVILPGAFTSNKELGHSLTQIILHGLQCVVKNKLDQSEIIFTQALQLPLFQRVPLKAFAYICLAVTANKRRKKGENVNRVKGMLNLVNSMDKLVEACESSPSMRMPKMIGLIKQLKKELNLTKVIRDQRQTLTKRQVSYRNETTKEVHPTGDALDLLNISVMVPGGAVSQPVTITLSHLNSDELHQSIQSSPWSSMLNILAAISIRCSPPVDRFEKPIVATVMLPRETRLSSTPQLRLLQSNYLSTWVDITNEPCTEISLEQNGRLTLRTDQTGWIIVASLQFDINKIMPIAVKSIFTEEPVVMNVNAYGYIFPDGIHAQISVFIVPHQGEGSNPSALSRSETPPGHRQIAFPHTFKAYKHQNIRITLQGQFGPDLEAGQTSLQSDIKIDGYMRQIFEKTVKISEASKGLYGKLTLSTFCMQHKMWEKLQDMNLSSPGTSHTSES